MNSNDYENEPLFYCTKCLSLAVMQDGKRLWCGHCGASAEHLDVTSIERWEELYQERHGQPFLQATPTPYDDIAEAYEEDAVTTITANDAINAGLIVRDCINLRINE